MHLMFSTLEEERKRKNNYSINELHDFERYSIATECHKHWLCIEKTTQIRSEKSINLWFYKRKQVVTFPQKEVEKIGEINETMTYFPAQNITVEPLSKMNVTFTFYQYDDIK